MKTPLKATLIAIAVVVVVAVIAVIVIMTNRPTAPDPGETSGALPGARTNSHVLDFVGPDAPTLVEFLDFECEACGGLYPVIEQVRKEYAGKINYVVRYFPLAGHHNSMNAAVAAEAAAAQGEFEGIYSQLFETQAQWGEQQTSQAALFRAMAEGLGLDMDAFDIAVADPAVQARVEEDLNDGRYLGVTSTPTFVLDGKILELTQLSDLTGALDAAIGR